RCSTCSSFPAQITARAASTAKRSGTISLSITCSASSHPIGTRCRKNKIRKQRRCPHSSNEEPKSEQQKLAQSLFPSPAIHRWEKSEPDNQPDSSGFAGSFS